MECSSGSLVAESNLEPTDGEFVLWGQGGLVLTASGCFLPRGNVGESAPTGNTVWQISTCQIISPSKIDGSSDGIFIFSFRLRRAFAVGSNFPNPRGRTLSSMR